MNRRDKGRMDRTEENEDAEGLRREWSASSIKGLSRSGRTDLENYIANGRRTCGNTGDSASEVISERQAGDGLLEIELKSLILAQDERWRRA